MAASAATSQRLMARGGDKATGVVTPQAPDRWAVSGATQGASLPSRNGRTRLGLSVEGERTSPPSAPQILVSHHAALRWCQRVNPTASVREAIDEILVFCEDAAISPRRRKWMRPKKNQAQPQAKASRFATHWDLPKVAVALVPSRTDNATLVATTVLTAEEMAA